ncbi:thioesterase II family protein [Streptomyces reniochalinae]|uniref:thioesterase II family protein n=1 Tax=Streptomyces reniochalinae TaxID=2250578 RepID=UPI001FE50A20|nr:alpha/beta fold hydrolase [Streptomyces reniochalinae]WOZ30690.1 Bpd1 [Streptomyces reniochalinae]
MTPSPHSALWLRLYRPAPEARSRLVCFPHAGGSASYYHSVARALAPDVEVLAVQYPGRQDRRNEPPVASLAELATSVGEVLDPWLDKPYAFFGHSMGALLAYQVARRLEGAGARGPRRLFVSGRRAPSCPRTENIHLRSDQGIVAHLKRLQSTAAILLEDEELLAMFLPALRADYKAVETCGVCHADVGCPVTVFSGESDPLTTKAEAEAWQAHTRRDAEVFFYPGGHFFLDAHAAEVLEVIRKRTDQDHDRSREFSS